MALQNLSTTTPGISLTPTSANGVTQAGEPTPPTTEAGTASNAPQDAAGYKQAIQQAQNPQDVPAAPGDLSKYTHQELDSLTTACWEKVISGKMPQETKDKLFNLRDAFRGELHKRINSPMALSSGFYQPYDMTLMQFDKMIGSMEQDVQTYQKFGVQGLLKDKSDAMKLAKLFRKERASAEDAGLQGTAKPTDPQERERIVAFAERAIKEGTVVKDGATGEPVVQIFDQFFPWPSELSSKKPSALSLASAPTTEQQQAKIPKDIESRKQLSDAKSARQQSAMPM
jgi:hypothetical protein